MSGRRRFLHYCAWPGCAAWGAFGVGAFPWTPRGRPDVKPSRGLWYCGAHIRLADGQASAAGDVADERRSPEPRQGALAL